MVWRIWIYVDSFRLSFPKASWNFDLKSLHRSQGWGRCVCPTDPTISLSFISLVGFSNRSVPISSEPSCNVHQSSRESWLSNQSVEESS